MSALLTSLGEVATSVLTYVGNVCSTITNQPLLPNLVPGLNEVLESKGAPKSTISASA